MRADILTLTTGDLIFTGWSCCLYSTSYADWEKSDKQQDFENRLSTIDEGSVLLVLSDATELDIIVLYRGIIGYVSARYVWNRVRM